MAFPSGFSPAALAANDSVAVAITSIGDVLYSADGQDWVALAGELSFVSWNTVVWAGTQFVAAGLAGTIATSSDGIAWSEASVPALFDIQSPFMAWNGAALCLVGLDGGAANGYAYTSPDAITWTPHALPASRYWSAVVADGTDFVAVATGSTYAATSPDGATWTQQTMPAVRDWFALLSGAGIVVAAASDSATGAYSDTAGASWVSAATPEIALLRHGAHNGVAFCLIGETLSMASADGATWSSTTMPVDRYGGPVAVMRGMFLALFTGGFDYYAYSSADGLAWAASAIPMPGGVSEASAPHAYALSAYITGTPDSLPDYAFSISSFALSKRDAAVSYYAVSAPFTDALIDALTARPNGVVHVLRDGEAWESFNVGHPIRYDIGPLSSSLSISGTRQETNAAPVTLAIESRMATDEGINSDGLLTLGLVPGYVDPHAGDSITWRGITYLIELIKYQTNASAQTLAINAREVV